MTSRTSLRIVAKSRRFRWIVYVLLALAGGSLTFVGAYAQQRASDEATFRKFIDSACHDCCHAPDSRHTFDRSRKQAHGN